MIAVAVLAFVAFGAWVALSEAMWRRRLAELRRERDERLAEIDRRYAHRARVIGHMHLDAAYARGALEAMARGGDSVLDEYPLPPAASRGSN